MLYTDPKLAPGGEGPGDAPEPPPTVSAYTGMGDVVPPPGPGWGPPPGPPGLYGQGEVPAIPSPALFPGAPIPGPPTIIPGSSPRERRWHVAPAKLGRRPHHRRRPVHRCLRKRGRRHDSRRARVGVPPARQGESRIHLSRVKRLAVVGACLALALTGCSFQGLNSLPLPGAVGGDRMRSPTTSRCRMSRRWSRIRRS